MSSTVAIIHRVAEELQHQGIPIHFEPGWETRGRPAPFHPMGLVIHHTATEAYHADYPTLGIIRDGRSDLAGPLAQFGIGRHTGTVFVIAAGHSNHAFPGGWNGLGGNSQVWGIEAENDGKGEPWSAPTLRSFVVLAGALARHTGFGPEMIACHREWNPAGKIDPTGIDGDTFRSEVAEYLAGEILDGNERDALMFTATFLQELKDGDWFVEDIFSRLDALDQRLQALESS